MIIGWNLRPKESWESNNIKWQTREEKALEVQKYKKGSQFKAPDLGQTEEENYTAVIIYQTKQSWQCSYHKESENNVDQQNQAQATTGLASPHHIKKKEN